MAEARIDAETRTEFGKGAARRTRRAGKIPAVLYGHGTDPQHLSLPALEFARVVREQGRNAVLTLNIGGTPAARADQDRGDAPDPALHRARRPAGDPPRREGRRRGAARRHRRRRARHPGHPGAQHASRSRRTSRASPSRSRSRSRASRPAPRSTPPTSRCPRAPSCAPTPRSWSSTSSPRRPRSSSRRELDTEGAGVVEEPPESATTSRRRVRGLGSMAPWPRSRAGGRARQSRPGVRRHPAQRRLPRRRTARRAGRRRPVPKHKTQRRRAGGPARRAPGGAGRSRART